MQTQVIDVSDLIDNQKIGRFGILLIVYMWFVMLVEGYDLACLSYAAPALSRAWHLSRGALGPAFGASVPGVVLGSVLLGYVGDRFGRRPAILIGMVVFAVFTLATMWASAPRDLIYLRFLAGIGLGGAIPSAFCLLSEFAPHRLRATWITLSFTGYMLGAGLGGVVSAALVAQHGWQVVFLVGGVTPLVIAAGLYFVVPESLRFLALNGKRPDEARRLAGKIAPALDLSGVQRFTVADEVSASAVSLKAIFAGALLYVTPLLWVVYIMNSMTLFFMQYWLPTLLEGVGVQASHAALISSLFSVGGAVGGLALMRFVDSRGAIAIVGLPLLGIPGVALLGHGLSLASLPFAVFAVGFCVVGTTFGLQAIASTIYPTAARSKGVGIALAVAKVGTMVGPVIGGAMLAENMTIRAIFHWAAAPLVVVALLATVMGLIHSRARANSFATVTHPTRSGESLVANTRVTNQSSAR